MTAAAFITSNCRREVFKGIIGAYGKIRAAPLFLAFIGDTRDPHVHEKIGYTGEGVILEATALGLGTCWVGKSFDQKRASSFISIEEYERVFAVTPVGCAQKESSFEERLLTGFGQTHKRKPLHEFVSGMQEAEWPEWIRMSLLSARIAPSAVNRQPWRFLVEPDTITISVDDLRDSYGIPLHQPTPQHPVQLADAGGAALLLGSGPAPRLCTPAAAGGLKRDTAFSSTVSTSVFQAWQCGQWPCHLEAWPPHSVQVYADFALAIESLDKTGS